MRILVAEDDPVSSLVIRKALEKLGHLPVVAGDGEQAWQEYVKAPFPIVISDWMMPNVDGIELCRRIRSHKDPSYTYIVMLTARGTVQDRVDALEHGADDYLIKPLDIQDLDARLKVARRILKVEDQLAARNTELEDLHSELEEQNQELLTSLDVATSAQRQFEELFEGLPVACFTFDRLQNIHRWNRASSELFGRSISDVMMRAVPEVFPWWRNHPMDAALLECTLNGERFEMQEWSDRRGDGTHITVLCSMFPLRRASGEIMGGIVSNLDITKRKELEHELGNQLDYANDLNRRLEAANALLAEQADTDGMTGLRNHTHFRHHLDTLHAVAVAEKQPLSVIMLDVDHFKVYNDTYGHAAGDEVLRGVAVILRSASQEAAEIARYGGEEFVLVLPDCPAMDAMEVAERLRSELASRVWATGAVTASFGVATLDSTNVSPSDLVDRADQALYRSKASGRNRVTHYDDLPGSEIRMVEAA